jgi:tRNA pseudouridine38-40 synthase
VRTIRLDLEYDGRRFHGWQRQPALRTVQGELETALAVLLREPVRVTGAGRTDAGVHALGQVASFACAAELPPERIRRGLNALTGDDLAVRAVAEAPAGFDARRSARARHYVYLLLHRRSALWEGRAVRLRFVPDPDRLNELAAELVGEHDFAAFSCHTPDERGTTTRVLYAQWEPWARGLALRIGAVRFLHKMVRCVVGRSLEVSRGRLPAEAFRALVRSPQGRGEPVAPAAGLYLAAVDYDEARPGGLDCPPPWPVL